MNITNSASRPGWQLLGQTELLSDTTADLVGTWLMEQLGPLNLPQDFVKKLLHSAQDTILRVLDSNGDTTHKHIHLAVLVPHEISGPGNSWGFFRIEKIDSMESNQGQPDHLLEFYLYLEGQ